MLLLLRDVLRKVQQASGLPSLPLPCEYFDIIAGCGTGGFIALLLGRLRLSVEHALECYARLVGGVFTQIKADGSFRATPLEKILKEISHRYGDGEETPILDSHPVPCKTFVCSREYGASGNASFRKLRTYANPTEPIVQCTLLQAVRATMGNPVFFKPMSVQKGESFATFLDAGDDHYNPVFDLFDEAQTLYPSRHIAYFLSIGPGNTETVGDNPSNRFANHPRLPVPVVSALQRLATCCDRTAAAFQEEHAGDCDGKYFRLSPSHPSHDGKMRWEQEEELKEFIAPYIAGIRDRLRFLIVAMKNEKKLSSPRPRRYEP